MKDSLNQGFLDFKHPNLANFLVFSVLPLAAIFCLVALNKEMFTPFSLAKHWPLAFLVVYQFFMSVVQMVRFLRPRA